MNLLGQMPHLRRVSNGRVDYNKASIRGYSGQTSTQIASTAQLDTDIASIVPTDPGIVVLDLTRNDPANAISVATSRANIASIIAYLKEGLEAALGHRVIFVLCDSHPGSDYPSELLALAQDTRSFHSPATGVYVAQTYNAWVTAPDGLTLLPNVIVGDNVHPAPIGAHYLGGALWATVSALVPEFDIFAEPGVLFGGEYSGTGGTKTAGTVTATGNVSDGYSVQVTAASGTVACSLVSSGGHLWQQFDVTDLANGASDCLITLLSNANQIGLVTPGTDYIDATQMFEVDAGATNLGEISFGARRQSGTSYFFTGTSITAKDSAWQGASTAFFMPTTAFSGLLRQAHGKVDVSGTLLGFRSEIRVPQSLTGSFTVRFALPQFRKYTGLMID